jgi:hypothetical protein
MKSNSLDLAIGQPHHMYEHQHVLKGFGISVLKGFGISVPNQSAALKQTCCSGQMQQMSAEIRSIHALHSMQQARCRTVSGTAAQLARWIVGNSTAIWSSNQIVTHTALASNLLSHLMTGRHIWPGCTACDRKLLQGWHFAQIAKMGCSRAGILAICASAAGLLAAWTGATGRQGGG